MEQQTRKDVETIGVVALIIGLMLTVGMIISVGVAGWQKGMLKDHRVTACLRAGGQYTSGTAACTRLTFIPIDLDGDGKAFVYPWRKRVEQAPSDTGGR